MNSKADSQRPEVYLNYKLRKKILNRFLKNRHAVADLLKSVIAVLSNEFEHL